MPFTLAHPAIVVPLARVSKGWLILSALVIGSMSPDFEYFVYLRPERTISHDLIGIPLLCVPSGLAVYWLFEVVMKRPMTLLLPDFFRLRLWPLAENPVSRPFLAILLSLAVGAFSHLAWDSFTHENGWAVERWPALASRVGGMVPVYKLLQHGSTFTGLGLLGVWSWNWLRRQIPAEGVAPRLSKPARHFIVFTLFLLAFGFATLVFHRGTPESWTSVPYRLVVRFVIAWLAALYVLTVAYCVGYESLNRGFGLERKQGVSG